MRAKNTHTIILRSAAMEVIAVTPNQAAALLAEAKKRAKRTHVGGGYQRYFKRVPGAVPSVTHTGSSCAGHQLVCVVRGLRKCAGIKHASMGRVLFAPRNKLARRHPRGVACFARRVQEHVPVGAWLASINPALSQYEAAMIEYGYDDTGFLEGTPYEELQQFFENVNMPLAHKRLIRIGVRLLREDHQNAAQDA
jgi:hypothetical protein